jgi:4,5-dihydroxyphthalate decarboxylase
MVRGVEFDVCELAPTTYIIARAYGAPFIALPIFVMRRFHHGGLLVRPDAGIKTPKDLEGRKVGVRAYSVTTGVWTRHVLMDDFGLDSSKVTWVVDDEEHVTQLALPPNVIHAPAGVSLAEMMSRGDLAAGFAANAGIGRTGAPTGGWAEVKADYPDLFQDPDALEAEYYARTGVYPMHGTIVVKDSVLAEHPWVAESIYRAFDAAKNQWLAKLDSGEACSSSDQKYLQLREVVGTDPLPYGIEPNRKTIEALESTAFKQGLTPRRLSMDEMFVDLGTRRRNG